MKRSSLPQSRRHIMVYDEDWEWLDRYYGKESDARIGTGAAIREIVHSRIKALKQKAIDLRDQRGGFQSIRDDIEVGVAE